jgi:cytochrome c oxidase cbb3-type subunit 2
MPNYPWLERNNVDAGHVAKVMRAMKTLGVPYTQADFDSASGVQGKTEMEAVVAYLQVLGTMVKFEDKDYRK